MSFPQTRYAFLTSSDALPTTERRVAVERRFEPLEQRGECVKADILPVWGRDGFQNGRDHINIDRQLLRLAVLPHRWRDG